MILSVISLSGCGETSVKEPELTVPDVVDADVKEPELTVPDVVDADESTAKNILSSNGLIPSVKYDYDDSIEEGNVIKTEPSVGSTVDKNAKITVYVSKGPSYYNLKGSVGYMYNINNINQFSWDDDTKGFYRPYVDNGYLYIDMYLCCVSKYKISFYDDFGTASINDSFDKTVPIEIIYDNQSVDNAGKKTEFTAKIPLDDLSVKKPTNLYISFDFLVNNEREDFTAGFDLSW